MLNRLRNSSEPGAATPPAPTLEIQFHSGNIRRGVRYLFLRRRHIAALATVGVLAGGGLLFSASLAPEVIRDALSRRDVEALSVLRLAQGARMRSLVDQLELLELRTEDLHLLTSKVYIAYGFDPEVSSSGQGGYPFQIPEAPSSIFGESARYGMTLQARIAERLSVLDTFLHEVADFESSHQDSVRYTPSTSPLRGDDFLLTSPYGSRRSPFTKALDFHAGVDLAAPVGTPIYAPAEGVVVFAGRYPLRRSVAWWRYGNMVVVRHADLFVSIYGHCDEVEVRTGQKVVQGDVLARVGNTGWSTSPHLHYEVRRRDDEGDGLEPVDPRIYILDHRWRDEERLLVRSRAAPDPEDYEPLPRSLARRAG